MLFPTKQVVVFLALSLASTEARRLNDGKRSLQDRVCSDDGGPTWNAATQEILATLPGGSEVLGSLATYQEGGYTIGSTTELLAEANDASRTGAPVEDGKSGDTNFPFGNLKAIATMGERSICPESKDFGMKLTGVPDGVGAYLSDDETVRLVYQNEGYGPLRYESWPFPVNDGAATIGGSHLHYIDYDRESLAGFMTSDSPASSFVVGAGEMIEKAYNLKGEPIGPRNRDGPTTVGAHYGNCDAEGNYVIGTDSTMYPREADWFYQSFCSAHLEEKHQWGDGIGVEDDLYMTNEEWIDFVDGQLFVGIPAHVVDLHQKTAYAVGAFSQGGFEKIVELNPQHPDYVMFAVSGYNGDFTGTSAVLAKRNEMFGPRPDGKNWIDTKYLNPTRIYIGVKGKMEDGSDALEDDFLARNGLRYGRIYGYTIDMSENGPTNGMWRDDFHKSEMAKNGAHVSGLWIGQRWRWDGVVRNYHVDAGWEFQIHPPYTRPQSGRQDYEWWTGVGPDGPGCKMEHVTPDLRTGVTGYVQGSTCGYIGHYYVQNIYDILEKKGGELPDILPGDYYVYQGELNITSQINLGGAGLLAGGRDATLNYDKSQEPGKGIATFEDVDGLELIAAANGEMYLIIQEDSGNAFGERMFITTPLEHEADGKELNYHFVAMAGGGNNTRAAAKVGIPAGTSCGGDVNEFSGIFDLSAFFLKNDDGTFVLSAEDTGKAKRDAEWEVPINDKLIIINLQAHQLHCGLIESFQADRGGQIYVYQPNI